MKKSFQRSLAGILSLVMSLGLLSVTADATDDAPAIDSDQTISDESIEKDVYTDQNASDGVTIKGDEQVMDSYPDISGTDDTISYFGSEKIQDSDDKDSTFGNSDDVDANVDSGKKDSSNNNSDTKTSANVIDIKKINGTWTYTVNGKADYTYTGFGSNSNGKWYVEKGIVTFKKNSVLKDKTGAIGKKDAWYYVIGSKVQSNYTGVANYKNSSGWWYIKKGQVDFSANTVAKNKKGWWYVKNGKVDLKYNGFASNSNGKWYIQKGKVTFKKNSVIKDKTGAIGKKGTWYYVVGSKVQSSYTGVANYKNSNGWWYIKKGQVDFSANTVAKNKKGWWYVKNGKVDLNYTGIAKNQNGWWYIKNGKVSFSAGDYSFAEKTSQIIDVKVSGSKGTLTLYNKSGNAFKKVLSAKCYVGKKGITSNKKEGDNKTPSGVYTLGQAFGVASDPGCTRDYLKLNSNYYWVDDSSSAYYNQLVNISKTGVAWKSAEHLIDNKTAYKYAIAINYNTSCKPNKGSAIFLHCSIGKATTGCVSVSETYMKKILQSLKSDTRIYIH